MNKEIIKTENAPKALGPYCQGCIYNGMIFVSGQIPLDPQTNEIVKGGIVVQAKRSLDNIKAILNEAGSTMDDLLKITVFLKDMNDFSTFNTLYGEYFTEGHEPTRTVVEVARLPKDALIKIDAIGIKH